MSESPIIIDPNNVTIAIEVEGATYLLDCSEFTAREVGILKRDGHIRGAMDIPQALQAGDLEAVAALAMIAMLRAGKQVNFDALLDAKAGVIKITLPEEKDPTQAT